MHIRTQAVLDGIIDATAGLVGVVDLVPPPAPGVAAETLGFQLRISGDKRVPVSFARRFNYRAMMAEALWNLQPTRDVTFLERYVKNMRDYTDGKPEAQWAYGPFVNSKLIKTLNKLRLNQFDRQAIIYTGIPRKASLKNSPPCLSSVQWFIRGGKLVQVVSMRSNDVYLGLPLDVFQFSVWHALAAAYLGLEMGEYIHNSASLHLYERDVEKARKFIVSGGFSAALPEVNADALPQAIERDTLGWIGAVMDHEGPGEVAARHLLGQQLDALAPFVQVLIGEYVLPIWRDLSQGGYGRGW